MPKKPSHLSPWKRFKQKWQNGCGHEMCDRAKKICLARGQIPCQVLFIGEAPGLSEDAIGSPFIGQAGHLMDLIVSQALPAEIRRAFTNIVGCLPRGPRGQKTGQPEKDQILQCEDRLQEFVTLCNPDLVVCVGDLAMKWFAKGDNHFDVVHVIHPAAILRMTIAAQPLEKKRAVVTINDALVGAGIL